MQKYKYNVSIDWEIIFKNSTTILNMTKNDIDLYEGTWKMFDIKWKLQELDRILIQENMSIVGKCVHNM
jgi:hypothetical protein